MKRLVVLVMALVFAFCTTSMAIELPSSKKFIKAQRKAAKVAAKYDRKAAKATTKAAKKSRK
jgi:hypothetical protein